MSLSTISWDCCRICLKEGEMHSVFEINEDLSTLADRIMHCSTINVSISIKRLEQRLKINTNFIPNVHIFF